MYGGHCEMGGDIGGVTTGVLGSGYECVVWVEGGLWIDVAVSGRVDDD